MRGLRRRGDLDRQLLQDAADLATCSALRLGEPALAEIEAVLEADPDVGAHQAPMVANPSGAARPPGPTTDSHRRTGLSAMSPHVHEVLGSAPMPPRMPKIVWTKSGGLTSLRSRKWASVVEMPDVVALELEPRAAAFAELLQDILDVLEGVAEDEVPRASR